MVLISLADGGGRTGRFRQGRWKIDAQGLVPTSCGLGRAAGVATRSWVVCQGCAPGADVHPDGGGGSLQAGLWQEPTSAVHLKGPTHSCGARSEDPPATARPGEEPSWDALAAVVRERSARRARAVEPTPPRLPIDTRRASHWPGAPPALFVQHANFAGS